MCCRTCFSNTSENRWEHGYIIYFARACVRAHTCTRKRRTCTRKGTCSFTHEETGWTTVMQREKPVETQKNLSILGLYFFKGRRKNWKEFVSDPPKKIHGLPDLFPGNSHFYASRRTETSQELPILCHPKDINFPDMTIFMPIGRRKKINLTTFFFVPPGNSDRNSFPERQEIPKYLRKNWKRSYIFTT